MNTGKIVLGVVAGVATGAVLGILFAPDKGTSTRKKISQKGEEISDGIKDRFIKVGDYISEKYDGTKEAARDLLDGRRSNMHDVKKEAKSATI